MTTQTCGTGGWTGPLPGDPDNNVALIATSAVGGIDIRWSYPTRFPHAVAHTLLYRGLTNNVADAVEIAVVAGNNHHDRLDNSTTRYYYWISIVSVNGTVADKIGPASAIAKSISDEVITDLVERIDSSLLTQELRTNIDNITVLGSNLVKEINDRINADDYLGAAIQQASNGVDEALSLIHTGITQLTEVDNVLVQKTETMLAQINANAALIQNEQTARVTADEALASNMSLIYATKDSVEAAVLNEASARATADQSLANSISTVQSTLNGNIASVQTNMSTWINNVENDVDKIGAMYTAKVDVNGYVGGFGVYNTGHEVQAAFNVDTFWVGKANVPGMKPFIVDNGKVYIQNATIQDGAITNAKIKNLEVDSIKIANNAITNITHLSFTDSAFIYSLGYFPVSVSVPANSAVIMFISSYLTPSYYGGETIIPAQILTVMKAANTITTLGKFMGQGSASIFIRTRFLTPSVVFDVPSTTDTIRDYRLYLDGGDWWPSIEYPLSVSVMVLKK